jgi:hypothetical protein
VALKFSNEAMELKFSNEAVALKFSNEAGPNPTTSIYLQRQRYKFLQRHG